MSLRERLDTAWRTLESDESAGSSRSLEDFDILDGRLQLAVEENSRELLIETVEVLEGKLPSTRGVKLVIRTTGGTVPRHRLAIRCVAPELHGVFSRFAVDVLERVRSAAQPGRTAIDVLRQWREMFAHAARWDPAGIVGVIGELHELLGIATRDQRAVFSWVGPYGSPQDFVNGAVALEVKTSLRHAVEVEVHGLEQLWSKPYEQLVLAVKHLARDPSGYSVGALAKELCRLGVSEEVLDERLELIGATSDVLEVESERFAVRGTRYFLVTAGAAFTPEHLCKAPTSGVTRVRYALALDSPGLEDMTESARDAFLGRLAKVPAS